MDVRVKMTDMLTRCTSQEERGCVHIGVCVCSTVSVLHSLVSVMCTLVSVLHSLVSVLCTLVSVLHSLVSVLCTLVSILHSLVSVLCSLVSVQINCEGKLVWMLRDSSSFLFFKMLRDIL